MKYRKRRYKIATQDGGHKLVQGYSTLIDLGDNETHVQVEIGVHRTDYERALSKGVETVKEWTATCIPNGKSCGSAATKQAAVDLAVVRFTSFFERAGAERVREAMQS